MGAITTFDELNIENYLAFRDRIAAMLDQNLYPILWLDCEVAEGRATCMVDGDSCILTEFRTFPSGAHEIHGLVAVGNMETIVNSLIPRAERIGKQSGCIIGSIASRQGWAKVLPDYHVYQVTLRKVL